MTAARTRSRRFGATAVAVAIAFGVGGTATTANAAAPAAAPAAASATTAASAEKVDYETWQRDVKEIIDNQARPYVEERTANPGGQKQAIVLDIDNTSLETDLGFTLPQHAVDPVLKLTQYAHQRGVDIFFVTARPGIIYPVTKCNLEHVGYAVKDLYVRFLPDLFKDVGEYKAAQRAKIEEKGYTIIANIGNTPTDLVGGHAERHFKLPDYNGQLS
ncbi:HAD family acid phosphatase [Streptomyces coffeae]|uniref:Hydrolase n=1 Tax=Streptomyces coffeae TaxID=621382 RepID=A0ABS1N7C2_9ACTN|nr:HAD family acid phosphatase [Streptomyces coffeae]MBL1095800.1 hydrolase [Streptomyces coffeae]